MSVGGYEREGKLLGEGEIVCVVNGDRELNCQLEGTTGVRTGIGDKYGKTSDSFDHRFRELGLDGCESNEFPPSVRNF